MLKSQCVQRLSHFLRNDTSLRPIRPQCRKISTTHAYASRAFPGRSRRTTAVLQISWHTRQYLPRRLGTTSIRFASTDTKPTPIAEVQPAYSATASQPVSDPPVSHEWATLETPNLVEKPNSLDDIVSDGQPQITEYIGYLKDMGLDYGWGPTAMVETLLEHVHIYTGAPWWISIGLTVIAIRVSIFRFYIGAQDTSARISAIKPLMAPIDKRQRAATVTQNQEEVRATQLERQALYKKFGIKITNLVWPLAFQIPLGFGTFRLMRGMCLLPVPGFDQGGLLWFSDLTVADPLYILPIATAATYYFNFKLGGETGSAANNMSPTTYRIFCYVLPSVTGLVAVWWPVGLQIPIFLNGVFAIVQSTLFRQPWFRNFCGIQPLGVIRLSQTAVGVNRGPKPAKPAPKGFIENIKTAYEEVIESGKKVTGKQDKRTATGRTDAEIKRAKAYEEKIAREAAQRRFEAKQAKDAKEEERRQRRTLQ